MGVRSFAGERADVEAFGAVKIFLECSVIFPCGVRTYQGSFRCFFGSKLHELALGFDIGEGDGYAIEDSREYGT